MRNILGYLVFAIFLSSSFDIFFNLNLGGFNFRFCYLASFAYILIFSLQKNTKARFGFIGWIPFLIWFLFIAGFVYHTPYLTRNLGYLLWLVFNILVCYVLYTSSAYLSTRNLIRYYILSFFVLALCGMAQFALSSVGIHVLVTSWWRLNQFPRVNAFSYEPSYYASYLLIGFVVIYHLTSRGAYFFEKRWQHIMLVSTGLAIFLSTSRMGILFLIVILAYDVAKMLIKSFLTNRISRTNLIFSGFLLVGILGTIIYIWNDEKLKDRYLSGTGVESTASHSKDLRIRQLKDVYEVFLKSPFEGYSLGGIAPAIAAHRGDPSNNQKKVKEHEGLNIFLEVLAASGIIGFMFFMAWLWKLFRYNILISNRLRLLNFPTESAIGDALRKALIAELLILILSQNILRPYLWILIGMVNVHYFNSKSLAWPLKTQTNT